MSDSIGKKIFQGTVIIVLVGVLSKVAAFISGVLLAFYLGTTYQSDAYYMVSGIKDVIYPMLSVGIWKVFLPLYKERIAHNDIQHANELANKAVSFFSLFSLLVVVLIVIFATQIVTFIAPGFHGETKELCIKLVRISAPMNIVIIASSVYASMLQCHNKFFGSQIREAVTHVPTIVAAIFFYNYFGVEALAVALVVGGIVRLAIEIPFVDWGYKFKPDFSFRSNEFLLLLKRLPSAFVSAGVSQINTLVDKAMASSLLVGAISGLTYGQKLMNVFSGLLSSAISTALYPQMVELIALRKTNELSNLMLKIVNVFGLLMIPATIGCVFFKNELVSAVYERGLFNAQSVSLTANVFALYCSSLFFIACNTTIINLFYGFGNTRIPLFISVENLVINVVFNLIFIRIWGVNGLALATSVTAFIMFVIILKSSKCFIQIDIKKIIITSFKVLFSAFIAFGIPRLFFCFYSINQYCLLVVSAILGSVVYFWIIKHLHISEVDYVISLFLSKLNIYQFKH